MAAISNYSRIRCCAADGSTQVWVWIDDHRKRSLRDSFPHVFHFSWVSGDHIFWVRSGHPREGFPVIISAGTEVVIQEKLSCGLRDIHALIENVREEAELLLNWRWPM